jgi:gliding motility-associated-like protein
MKHDYFFLFFMLLTYEGKTQVNKSAIWTLQSACVTPQQVDRSTSVTYDQSWVEVQEKRTLYSSLYQNKKGDVKARFSLKPIHYLNNEKQLVSIDYGMKESLDGWAALQQPFPTYLSADGGFALSSMDLSKLTFGESSNINGQRANHVFQLSDNIAFYEGIIPHVDKQVVFLENAVKFSYRFNEQLATEASELLIEEKLVIPNSYRIEKEMDDQHKVYQRLTILDEKGLIAARLEPIICFDALGQTHIGRYEVLDKEDGKYLQMFVSSNWLNDSERAYPVYIDPVISGPLSTWNNGYMPSCFMPVYNKDSIQVTIPAGITATGVYVSGSFYADPFTFATMSQGAMYYSSSCGSSSIFTVTGATATLPGTAYLDSFNLMNPLSCCIAESCTDVSFWVRMHIGRNALGSGCNINYIRYDPFASIYPFEVIVYGKTPETYGNQWFVNQTPICSNTCTFNATAYARYGVAPYTFSHPWSTELVTVGQNIGCANGSTNHVFTLTNPNCPVYCDSLFTSLVVPPPVIIDACGTQILNIAPETKPIIPAAEPALIYDSVLCQGESINIQNSSCLTGGISHYFGDASGDGNIQQFISNTTDSALLVQYYTYAEINGCVSDTTQINIEIYPNPIAQVTINPNPVVVTNPFSVQDASLSPGGTIVYWNWDLADSSFSQSTSFSGSYVVPGQYPLCLTIQNDHGCIDSICTNITVVPAEITNINVITSDGDGVNDQLSFEYLSFYPENELFIFNRWGQLLYSAKNYDNSWDGYEHPEGTYFYVLKILELDQTLQSFFQLVKN